MLTRVWTGNQDRHFLIALTVYVFCPLFHVKEKIEIELPGYILQLLH